MRTTTRCIPILFAKFLLLGLVLSAQAQSPRKIKIMPMGNSITSGFGLTGAVSYRYYLWKKLEAAGWTGRIDFVGRRCGAGFEPEPPDCGFPLYPASEWDWDSEAHAGMATPYFLFHMPSIIAAETPDIVLMHLGTNDILQGFSIQASRNNIGAIIDGFRSANPRVVIMLAQVIPLPSSPDSLAYLNSLIAALAAEKNTPASPVILVDHYSGWNNNTDFRLDQIHPNGCGERKMADTWYARLLPVLEAMTTLRVRMASPSAGTVLETGKPVMLKAVSRPMTGVAAVRFMGNNILLGFGSRVNDSAFALQWAPPSSGLWNLRAIVVDSLGQYDTSAVVAVTAANLPIVNAPIPSIQDTGAVSPFVNERVRTTGVVTCIARDSLMFWMQDPSGDGFAATPDGIAVAVSEWLPSLSRPAPGDLVEIVARVEEFAAHPGDRTITRLTQVDSIRIVSPHHSLPPAAAISFLPASAADLPVMAAAYRRVEGMLVKFTNAPIVAPLDDQGLFGIVPEFNLTAGQQPVAVVLPGAGAEVNYRPQVVAIGDCALRTAPVARRGATVASVVGVVNYRNGMYVVEALPESLHISPVQPLSTPITARTSNHGSLAVATFNLGGFFDTLDTPGKSDPVLTPCEYMIRIEKCSRAVTDEFRLPGILALQGVENTAILADVAARVNAVSGRGYAAVSFDTPDARGLECGFLYDTLVFNRIQAYLMSGPAIDSSFGQWAPVRGPQPLVGVFSISGTWVAVVNIDFVDRSADQALFALSWPFARPSEAQRIKQARAVRNWVNATLQQYPGGRIIIAGSVNDFPFAEANETVDPVSVLKGNAALGETVFTSAYDTLPVESRHTATAWMRAVMFNHILISPSLLPLARGVDVLRIQTPFEAQLANDPSTAARCGSADGLEIRF